MYWKLAMIQILNSENCCMAELNHGLLNLLIAVRSRVQAHAAWCCYPKFQIQPISKMTEIINSRFEFEEQPRLSSTSPPRTCWFRSRPWTLKNMTYQIKYKGKGCLLIVWIVCTWANGEVVAGCKQRDCRGSIIRSASASSLTPSTPTSSTSPPSVTWRNNMTTKQHYVVSNIDEIAPTLLPVGE